MPNKDVTDQVDFQPGDIDSEYLPLTKCVCGAEFKTKSKEFPQMGFARGISIYPDWADPCENCGRRLYFSAEIRVYEVTEDA